MTKSTTPQSEYIITLTPAKRADLIEILEYLQMMVAKNSTNTYAEIIARRVTERRIKALLKLIQPTESTT